MYYAPTQTDNCTYILYTRARSRKQTAACAAVQPGTCSRSRSLKVARGVFPTRCHDTGGGKKHIQL